MNRLTLRREKYNLIKEIKNKYNLEDFVKSHVSEYKLNASIYNVMESTTSKYQNPATLMSCKTYLIEHIIDIPATKNKQSLNVIKEYSRQDKDLRLLSYKILLEKFNSKYGKLSSKQKNLLKEYINNISNTSTLKKYISEEVTTVNKAINLLTKKVKDTVVKIKLQEVNQQLGLIIKEKKIKDTHLISLLRSYDLVRELKNVTK